jgi:TruD family tRNA pseudouridine synthase
MSAMHTQDLQATEQDLIRRIRAAHPERVTRERSPDPDFIMGRIGVTYLTSDRPEGYLRLYPQDFLVEEILTDGSLVPLAGETAFQSSEDQRTLWVDLVKAGISGPHAMLDLANGLGIDPAQIGYAGIKDSLAITSQRISLRGVTKEMLDAFHHERMWLRPIRYGSGALQPGDLAGNRFTILVRSGSTSPIDAQLEVITRRGFYNIFGPQRFGPRLISHRLGQSILKNDIEKVLRMYFGEPGPFDIPLFRDARKAMDEVFGDWKAMLDVAGHFPFTLRDEIRVLEALLVDPKKTRGALAVIKDQVKLWVYAYGSWLMNRRLSMMIESRQEIPQELRLPLTPNGVLPEYAEMMQQDGTMNYRDALSLYPYIPTSTKSIPSMIVPTRLSATKIPQGWIVRFSLGRGAYATSCLSHIFRFYEGLPVPEWVPGGEVDAFVELGEGNVSMMRERFERVLVRRDAVQQEEGAAEE